MHFIATADTDIGISKDTNQDSALIKHAKSDGKEVLLAVVCDGMGGLSKGELASATVVRAFAKWFDGVGAWKITVSSADAFMPLRLSMASNLL